MTPDMAAALIPAFSQAQSISPRRTGTGAASPQIDSVPIKESSLNSGDTIELSSRRQLPNPLEQKGKNTADNNRAISQRSAANVEFVYDLNGDLITRYLDSSRRLIYQTPSELMLRAQEAVSKSDSSVDTKA